MLMLLHMLFFREYFRTKVTSSIHACFNALGYVLKLEYMLHFRIKVTIRYVNNKYADQTAHPHILISVCTLFTAKIIYDMLRCEKIGIRGFRPDPTQTGLCSHRRWLEA